MKVFILGKVRWHGRWLEGCVAGLRGAGHEVRVGVTRNPLLNHRIERIFLSERIGSPMISGIVAAIRRFEPDLILAVSAHEMIPLAILERVAAMPGRAPLVGWVGDGFREEHRRAANLFDLLAYIDTGLLDLHHRLGFAPRAILLPHAANPLLGRGTPGADRSATMSFVGAHTQQRRAVIGGLQRPMAVYGVGWRRFDHIDHQIHARRVWMSELGRIYGASLAALNIRNEVQKISGLNQRSFDPYLSATPVVCDPQADLELCFEPGKEVLVYRDAESLNDIYARLQAAPEEAAAIGRLGRKRVLAEHTYAHRLETMMVQL